MGKEDVGHWVDLLEKYHRALNDACALLWMDDPAYCRESIVVMREGVRETRGLIDLPVTAAFADEVFDGTNRDE